MGFASEGKLQGNSSLALEMPLFHDSMGNIWCVLRDTFYSAGLAPAALKPLFHPWDLTIDLQPPYVLKKKECGLH